MTIRGFEHPQKRLESWACDKEAGTANHRRQGSRAALTLAGLALLGSLAGLLSAGSVLAEPAVGEAVTVELNKLEPNGAACRAYLVAKNAAARAFDSLKLDLVMFDRNGVVAKRLAVQAAPLPVGKTSLKVFDIEGHDCAEIGSILLNDVLACAPAPPEDANGAASGCLELVAASARGEVPFTK
jgi:hypothetical protein